MCIYCGTNKYRKIYENHVGPIPKDEEGRTYEIHHIDGDKTNNTISNLQCVSIKEHYDIHYQQGDWAACYKIGQRLRLSPEIISELIKRSNADRIENGTHHLLGPKMNLEMMKRGIHPSQNIKCRQLARQRELTNIQEGTHKFLDKSWQHQKCRKAVESGSHNFLGGEIQRKTSRRRVREGTHNLLSQNNPRIQNRTHHFFGGEIQRKSNFIRLAAGTHPSQIKMTCPKCNMVTSVSMYKRWHGDNCRKGINNDK